MNLRIYLDPKPDKRGFRKIYAQYSFPGQNRKALPIYPEGMKIPLKIHPNDWNQSRQRARKEYKHSATINGILRQWVNRLEENYYSLLRSGITPTPRAMVLAMNANGNPEDFWGFVSAWLEDHFADKAHQTKKNVRATINVLKAYEEENRSPLGFPSFGDDFKGKFLSWQIAQGNNNQTINKHLQRIAQILRAADRKGYKVPPAYKDFKVKRGKANQLSLTMIELFTLRDADLPPPLRKAADIFLFMCFACLRYSEFLSVDFANYKDGVLKYWSKKKSRYQIQYLNKYALQIWERNGYNFGSISNQKLNEYIKEAGREAGLLGEFEKVRRVGGQVVREVGPKCDYITSHTARRTFITISSMELGLPIQLIRPVAGHSADEMTEHYIHNQGLAQYMAVKKAWDEI